MKQLQNKWKVSTGKLALILVTFATGGSLTGYAGKKLMTLIEIENPVLYIPIYIITITLLWPLMVLSVSIPLGQFHFFKNYIGKMGQRILRRKNEQATSIQENQTHVTTRQAEIIKQRSKTMQETKVQLETANIESHSDIRRDSGLKHIVIFASGAGSNARQIIHYFKDSKVAKVALIVCNKPGAGVISIAQNENIPVLLIEKEQFFRGDGYVPELQNLKTDLIVLAGFLWKIPQTLINAFPRRIINIHPALLPKYGGKGMYGQYVHQSVLNAGEVESGITIHYVDEHYDNGDIIFQTACPILDSDTPEDLAQRIHQLEHRHYPLVIENVLKEM